MCVCVSPRACFQGRNEHGENLGKVCVCRLVPVLRAETNTVKIVEKCVCRLVPVLRAETNTQESVDARRCRLVPVLRAETKTQKSVDVCVCASLRACFYV